MDTQVEYPLCLNGPDIPMVQFRNVSKRYGGLTVLHGLDLDISEGEMVSIIGPSGSGKTTVLRVWRNELFNVWN